MSARLAAWLWVLALAPSLASSQAGGAPHTELTAFGSALERAVAKVSRPGTLHLLGGAADVRGYYLDGYGAFFSVPPRALPAERSAVVVWGTGGGGDQTFNLAIRELERGLLRIEPEEMRAAIESRLQALRRPERDARAAAATTEREEARQGREVTDRDWRRLTAERERELRNLEAQAEVLQREAERIRAIGELHMERIEREIQLRLAASPAPASPARPPAPPEAPASSLPEPPAPPERPLTPPPWRFWFETAAQAEQPRSDKGVIAEVRGAVTDVLMAEGASLRQVRPEEFVAVAIDFVAPAALGMTTQPRRTLVLRVKKKEIDEHRAGRLPAERLAQRIEAVEY